ncbi:hypothetical protein [Rubrivirga marina]|uniref:Lipoprotein n=1 Tax=Rubrivirga marina TaxID=1196024 RepID=A0A271J0T0_9BACT|nr:hypothetical protein [Rubrivirga marina]PAP77121.1 hypothetical protein BSZ37_12135 [Rubrivirga marina]
MRRPLANGLCVIALLLAAAALPGCDAVETAATADAATVTETPLRTRFTLCTGEVVVLRGTTRSVDHVRADRGGGLHLTSNYTLHVTGTGSLGNTYRGNENGTLSLNLTAGQTYTITQSTRVIGRGAAPDFRLKAVLHVTANAQGVLTSVVERVRVSDTCG